MRRCKGFVFWQSGHSKLVNISLVVRLSWAINNSISRDADANARYLAQCTGFFNGDAHPLTSKFANQLLCNVFCQYFQKLVTVFRHPVAQALCHLFAIDGKALSASSHKSKMSGLAATRSQSYTPITVFSVRLRSTSVGKVILPYCCAVVWRLPPCSSMPLPLPANRASSGRSPG